MADNTVVHMGENSPEYVAYRLMLNIAAAEGRSLNANTGKPVTRAWILQTYHQCKLAVDNGWDAKSILKERPLEE